MVVLEMENSKLLTMVEARNKNRKKKKEKRQKKKKEGKIKLNNPTL